MLHGKMIWYILAFGSLHENTDYLGLPEQAFHIILGHLKGLYTVYQILNLLQAPHITPCHGMSIVSILVKIDYVTEKISCGKYAIVMFFHILVLTLSTTLFCFE